MYGTDIKKKKNSKFSTDVRAGQGHRLGDKTVNKIKEKKNNSVHG